MTAVRHVVLPLLYCIAVVCELAFSLSLRQKSTASHHTTAGCSYNIGSCPHHMLCIDDGLFGVCRASNDPDGDEVYIYHLTKNQSVQSKTIVDRLKELRLNLSGPYSQCIMLSIMFSYRHGLDLDLSRCDYIILSPTSMGQRGDVASTVASIIKTEGLEQELHNLTHGKRRPVLDLHNVEQSTIIRRTQQHSTAVPVTVHSGESISAVARQPSPWSKYAFVVYALTATILAGAVVGSVMWIIRCCKKKQKHPDNVDGELSHVVKLIPGFITTFERSPQAPSWLEDQPPVYVLEPSTAYKILEYFEDVASDRGDKLQEHWQTLCQYRPDALVTCNVALSAENMCKNRYGDITLQPYDHTRIILNADRNVQQSDYINASAITDYDPQFPSYIVTQLPLADTQADFWQMIWEQQCTKIVDLTTAEESVQSYWPQQLNRTLSFHTLEVCLQAEFSWCHDFVVRVLHVTDRHTQNTLTVNQFHFIHWPEDSVPRNPKQFLAFRRKLKKSYSGKASPTVVLCSDGMGRSGTYCLIDLVLSRLSKGAKEIDLVATVEHLRDQRQSMIRTKEQFVFALTAIIRELHDSIGE